MSNENLFKTQKGDILQNKNTIQQNIARYRYPIVMTAAYTQ